MSCNHYQQLERCYLIAEIGVNHNGDMQLAREMISAAKDAGADAVKFQTFTAEALVTQGTPKVGYQESTTAPEQSHFDMIKSLELGREQHQELNIYCHSKNIAFLSTPYDVASVDFLEELGVAQYKVASADLVDLTLHERLAQTGKPVILSVGMASLGEVEQALAVYRRQNHNDLILLHCVSNYPCSPESLNLRVMQTLQQAFQLPVGYSDHSVGLEAAVLSIALGARLIEKHFTLDKSLPGPDHKASSTPAEFSALARAVRKAERMLGSAVKQCQEEERQMASVSRKSVTLKQDFPQGHVLKRDDLLMKRPGTGLAAREIPQLLGKRLRQAMTANSQPSWTDLDDA